MYQLHEGRGLELKRRAWRIIPLLILQLIVSFFCAENVDEMKSWSIFVMLHKQGFFAWFFR